VSEFSNWLFVAGDFCESAAEAAIGAMVSDILNTVLTDINPVDLGQFLQLAYLGAIVINMCNNKNVIDFFFYLSLRFSLDFFNERTLGIVEWLQKILKI